MQLRNNIFNKILTLSFVIVGQFWTNKCFAQDQDVNDVRIGGWRSYLPYQKAKYVTQSNTEIIVATEFAIVTIDKEDNSVQFKSKVDGLSDAGVQLVKYNTKSDILLIAYANSNIDLVDKNGSITNVRDILDNISIIGDKTIYDVYIADATYAYLATGFGILKLNMKKGEFDFTTFTNSKVRGVHIWRDQLYIASEKGLFSFPITNTSLNPADFNTWTRFAPNVQGKDYTSRAVAVYKDKLYFDVQDTLFAYNGIEIQEVLYRQNAYISFLNPEGNNLLIGQWYKPNPDANWGGKLYYINNEEKLIEGNNDKGCVVDLYYALEDTKSGKIWLADIELGIKYFQSINGNCSNITTNSPFSHFIEQLALDGNNVFIASGGYTTNNGYNYNPDGFFFRIDNSWGFKNRINDATMKDGYLYGIHTVTSLAIDSKTNKRYVGSFWGGLLEVSEKGEILKHYTTKNSTLQAAIGDPNSTRVGGIAFDTKGNLWVSNNSAEKPISVLTNDGKWYAMGSNLSNAQIYKVTVDPITGYKWFIIGKGSASIIVYDEGKNIADENDDRYIILNSTNSSLPGSKVNSVEPDLDGKMWVTTDDGVIWFSCGTGIFDKATKTNFCNGSLPTTVVDGIPEYLLKYNNVNTVAIDGANRKWFGTSDGLFIQSPDGKTQIAYFNQANSPLFDNNIIDIAINNSTGEVFVATNKGLQSIKTEALLGQSYNTAVIAYPNPVRPEYDGIIAIKGLAQDANVKITDINGRLVYETSALGGQATWNGRDYNGNQVAKGVYLIFSTYTKDVDYPDEAVGKILFMK